MITNEPKKRGRKPKPKVTPKKEPKKRGRKPKPKVVDEKPKVHKKRGRRKKCDIDSMSKISGFCANGDSIDTIGGDKLKFSNKHIDIDKICKNGGEKISFGNFSIGVRASEEKDNSGLIQKFHEDTKKNSKCIIELSDFESESDEDIKGKTMAMSAFARKKIKKIKKIKKRKERVWKEKSNLKLSLVLDKYRGPKNEKFEWPETTEIYCWWCCHPFECSPTTLPYKFDEMRNRFKVMGIFCSWPCAKSYAHDDSSVLSSTYSMLNLTEFTRQIYGHTIRIPCAPPRQALKIFGGNMTIKEFREKDPNIYVRINKINSVLDPNVYFSVNTE